MNFAHRYIIQSCTTPHVHPLREKELISLFNNPQTASIDMYVIDIRIHSDYTLHIPNLPKNCNALQERGIHKVKMSLATSKRPYEACFNLQRYLSNNIKLSKTIKYYYSSSFLYELLVFQTEQEAVAFLEKIKSKLIYTLEISIENLTDNYNFIKQL